MSKVEIVGLRPLLGDVLDLVREKGNLHIDPTPVGFIEKSQSRLIHGLLPDQETMLEKLFLEELLDKIRELFSYLPSIPVRTSYLSPQPIIDTISNALDRHLATCKALHTEKELLRKELEEMGGYRSFLDTIGTMMGELQEVADLDFVGVTIKDPHAFDLLTDHLQDITGGSFELLTEKSTDGTLVGLIAFEKGRSDAVRNLLSEKMLPEYKFPETFEDLTFFQKVVYLKRRIAEIESSLAKIEKKLNEFTRRWGPIYISVKEWINNRFSIIQATGLVFESSMCFFVYGWIPSDKVEGLKSSLKERFNGDVYLGELGLLREDLDRVPVVLKNPSYFKPFENFTRLLPLPSYASYDPTPFIGVFFPLLFGMILGDTGYGLVLLVSSGLLIRRKKKHALLQDVGKILGICSIYSVVFGILYGELFGNLGHMLFGLKPLLIERQANILPMLFFAVSVGFVHIVLGLILGVITAFRKKTGKEAMVKILNILLIFCLAILLVSFFGFYPELLAKPVIIAILVMTPVLLFTGGLLAPLELLKNFGNIISYVRIMAIGLTSVLLAYVANRLSGLTGDIILGVVVGGLIHLINLVIGVFSSTIHSLRLHYVEFFNKFIELGGKKYKPLH